MRVSVRWVYRAALTTALALGVFAGVTAGTVGVPSSPAAVGSESPLIGLHQDLTWNGDASQRSAAIHEASTLGARVSRNSLMWDKIEPTEGTYDWSTTDAVVAELQSAGIEPLFVVVGSPTWANGADPNDPNAAYVIPTSGPAFERWLAEFQSFVALAASRYGDRVHFWEVWNEENERATWRPQPNVDLYARTSPRDPQSWPPRPPRRWR